MIRIVRSGPPRRRRDPIVDLALLTSLSVLALLTLSWFYLKKDSPAGTVAIDLVLALLPNFAAILLVFVIVATVLERRGLSPEQQLRRNVVRDIVRNVKPVPGIKALHGLIQNTPYGDVFASSNELELVGRWYNETLSRHPLDLGRFLDAGGRMTVLLTDPEDEVLNHLAAQQYSGRLDPSTSDIAQVRQKTLDTICILERFCQDESTRTASQISIHLSRMPLNAWGIRARSKFDGDVLFFAPYDHVRAQTSVCPTVVYDLDQSDDMKDFWRRELVALLTKATPLNEWRQRAAEQLVATDGSLNACSAVALRGNLVNRALRAVGGEQKPVGAGESHTALWVVSNAEWRLVLGEGDVVESCSVIALQ